MPTFLTKILAGFIAGTLAVLIFHQGAYVLIQYLDANVASFKQLGNPLQGAPYRMQTEPLWPELFRALNQPVVTLPIVANQAIWGGLWGILFAFLLDNIPTGPTFIRALVFAMIFPMLLGSWLLVAYIKGRPLFSGAFAKDFNPLALRNGFLLNGIAYGIGLGILYPWLAGMMSGRRMTASHA